MSLTREQIQEVFEWVSTHPDHVDHTIEYAVDKDHPERVYHAILAFPSGIWEYDENEKELKHEMSRTDAMCDYTFRQHYLKTYQCPIQGSPIRGKVRCPFHSSLVFDLIDLADPITLPRTRSMVPQNFEGLRERSHEDQTSHQFKQISPSEYLEDLNSRVGNGIQVIQVTEDEVLDTMNERLKAHAPRVVYLTHKDV